MELFFAILPALVIPPAIFIALSWVYQKNKQEEATDGYISRTRYPRRFTVSSMVALIVTVLLFVIGAILIFRFETNHSASRWIAYSISALLFISLTFCLVMIALRTYEIIRSDGILVARLFEKKFVNYSDMASYRYELNQLTVYDREHKVLFGVYDNRVGMQSLLRQLDCKRIRRE